MLVVFTSALQISIQQRGRVRITIQKLFKSEQLSPLWFNSQWAAFDRSRSAGFRRSQRRIITLRSTVTVRVPPTLFLIRMGGGCTLSPLL